MRFGFDFTTVAVVKGDRRIKSRRDGKTSAAKSTILTRALRVIPFTRDYPRFPGRGFRNNADRAYLEQTAKYDDNSTDKKCREGPSNSSDCLLGRGGGRCAAGGGRVPENCVKLRPINVVEVDKFVYDEMKFTFTSY